MDAAVVRLLAVAFGSTQRIVFHSIPRYFQIDIDNVCSTISSSSLPSIPICCVSSLFCIQDWFDATPGGFSGGPASHECRVSTYLQCLSLYAQKGAERGVNRLVELILCRVVVSSSSDVFIHFLLPSTMRADRDRRSAWSER